MQRAPLKEVAQIGSTTMPADPSTKHTPDKPTDKAAVAAAAKLLDSAKKSQTKRLAKRLKLSLQKPAGSAGSRKQAVRALALGAPSDLNDTVEFKDSMPVRQASKPPPASRKRKLAQTADQTHHSKILRSDSGDAHSRLISSSSGKMAQTKAIDSESTYNKVTFVENSTKTVDTDDAASPHTSSDKDDEKSQGLSSVRPCPTCREKMPQEKLLHHTHLCLREQFARGQADTAASKDGAHASTTAEHDTEGSHQRDGVEAKTLPTDYFFCQLCQKDLSHMNSHRRTLHINNCIDQEEKKKKTEEERQQALEAAKEQVLDCPMCGKVLRTVLGRKNHLKKCASSLGVQPDQLLQAVKRQEEEHQATLAAGILPPSFRPGRHKAPSTRKGLVALPKSKLDEDTQLALAISSSLQPDTDSNVGPSTSDTATTAARKGRRHKQEEDYLLLSLTQSQAAGRVELRVADLLTQQEEDVEEDVPPLPAVCRDLLHGDRTQALRWSADTDTVSKMFWKRASLEEQSDTTGEAGTDNSLAFYVRALMPPVEVSSVVAGSKIRRMSEIPGRSGSQEARTAQEGTEEMEESSNEAEDTTLEELPPPSTQTAALLADMAAEADGIDATQLTSSFAQPPACAEQRQAEQDLLCDFATLVNQREFSDIVIHAAGATTLYAHRAILSVRCPALLKLSEEGRGMVDLSECCSQSVVSVLNYVYAAVTQVDDRWLQDTLQLADRLELRAFAEICRTQLSAPASQRHTAQHPVRTSEHGTTAPTIGTPRRVTEDDGTRLSDSVDINRHVQAESCVPVHGNSTIDRVKQDSEMSRVHAVDIRAEENIPAHPINIESSGKDDEVSTEDSISISIHSECDSVVMEDDVQQESSGAFHSGQEEIGALHSRQDKTGDLHRIKDSTSELHSRQSKAGAFHNRQDKTDALHSKQNSTSELHTRQGKTGALNSRQDSTSELHGRHGKTCTAESGQEQKDAAPHHQSVDQAENEETATTHGISDHLQQSALSDTWQLVGADVAVEESTHLSLAGKQVPHEPEPGKEKGFHSEQDKAKTQENFKPEDRLKPQSDEEGGRAAGGLSAGASATGRVVLLTDEGKAQSLQVDKGKNTLSAELKPKPGDDIQTECVLLNTERERETVKVCSDSTPAVKSGTEPMNKSFSEDDDIHLLDMPLPSEEVATLNNRQTVVTGFDDVIDKESQQNNPTLLTTGHGAEPADSIEISDDDLFSGDEIDISLLPSTPQHCRQMSRSQRESVAERREPCDSSVEHDRGPPTLQPETLTEVSSSRLSEDDVHTPLQADSRDRGEMEHSSSVLSARVNASTGRRDRLPGSFEDNVLSFSVSAVETSSYRAPSLSSPHVTHFKTSTPQALPHSQSQGRTGSRTGTGSTSEGNWIERGETSATDVTFIRRPESERGELVPEAASVGDFTSPAARERPSSSVVDGARRTPCVSVVEQDSLYVTPVVEQSRVRKTFQLVTPLSHQQGTPALHTAVVAGVEAADVCDEEGERGLQQCGEGGVSGHGHTAGGVKEGGGTGKDEIDSDSDLEIIDTSLNDAPSPKFSLASKPTSSQSQSGAEAANQHSPCPQPLGQSDSSPVLSSQPGSRPASQSAREQGKSSSDYPWQGEASTPSKSRDPDRSSVTTPVRVSSQRSADSDRELLKAVEMVSQQLAAAVSNQGAETSPHMDKADDPSPVEADVWEGFDNMDVYNPDLDLLSHDLTSVTSPMDTAKAAMSGSAAQSEPVISSAGPQSSSGDTPVRSAVTSFKTHMKLPLKILVDAPEELTTESLQTPLADGAAATKTKVLQQSPGNKSAQRQSFSSKRLETQGDSASTPDRLNSSGRSPCSRERGKDKDSVATDRKRLSGLAAPQSPGGFLVEEDDTAAADSSFLWCEENAPVEDDRIGAEDGLPGEGVLVMGVQRLHRQCSPSHQS